MLPLSPPSPHTFPSLNHSRPLSLQWPVYLTIMISATFSAALFFLYMPFKAMIPMFIIVHWYYNVILDYQLDCGAIWGVRGTQGALDHAGCIEVGVLGHAVVPPWYMLCCRSCKS